jgi:tryptophan-rich sensory protein
MLALAGWIVLSFLVAGVAGAARPGAWYRGIRKPSWNPPDWLFAPVWSVMYTLMGVAAWLVWKERGATSVQLALTMFIVQLLLNALWSWIFFGWHRMGAALVEVLVLWSAVLATLLTFWQVTPLAGKLLVPYLLWVSFASFLNFTLWRLNRA